MDLNCLETYAGEGIAGGASQKGLFMASQKNVFGEGKTKREKVAHAVRFFLIEGEHRARRRKGSSDQR